MNENEDYSRGHRLLTAVERILDGNDNLIALVRDHQRRAQASLTAAPEAHRREVSAKLITHFSNRTAISGGALALPAMIPGAGTLLAVAGGALADMGLMLKFEVEMALALTQLHGFDITQENERQIAFLLASVSTYDAHSGRNFFVDVAAAEGTAVWKYAPREASKLLLNALTRLALINLGKGVLRALPLVGVAVGASFNKVLTQRVGERCRTALEQRQATAATEPRPPSDVVDAKFTS